LGITGYGTRVPSKIRDQFEKLLKSSPIVPSLSHYLKFVHQLFHQRMSNID